MPVEGSAGGTTTTTTNADANTGAGMNTNNSNLRWVACGGRKSGRAGGKTPARLHFAAGERIFAPPAREIKWPAAAGPAARGLQQ